MKRLSITELEKMTHSKYLKTQQIRLTDEVLGDNKQHLVEFDIFDGFAYCHDFNGHEYYMMYPRKEFIKLSNEMEKTIREYLELDKQHIIGETEILVSYNTLFKNQ